MTYTEIGAAVGFLTGVYTLFDRFMKGRPIAYLVASGPATNAVLSLRVKNVGSKTWCLGGFFRFRGFTKSRKTTASWG